MIGILCSNDKEESFAVKLHSLFHELIDKNDSPIAVFSIPNIDVAKKEFTGSLISKERIKYLKAELPSVIFNFSLQQENKHIKKVRFMTEMKDVMLINDINRFDQLMIMDMLSVSRKTSESLLPYHAYDKKIRNFKPDENKSYIAIPSRGSSLSRIIYTRPEPNSDKVSGNLYVKKGHIRDYIDASMCQKKWIFIEVPDILTHNNVPLVVRAYLQRGKDGAWMLLKKNSYPISKLKNSKYLKKVDEISLIIINHVNKYIPSLGFCFIDFILDKDVNPYFLHLGGFEKNLLYEKQTNDFYKNFYKNLLYLNDYYTTMEKGD